MTSAPSTPDLAVHRTGSVAVVTLLGDERLNAMRRTSWRALRDTLATLEADDSVRSVVITGEGTRAFSAGGDIHGYKALGNAGERYEFIVDCMRTFAAVEQLPKPVVAAVNGVALGGGFELLLACDAVVAGDSARFGVPEARLGLMPGFGVTRMLDHLGAGWARYLVLSGDTIDASTAERHGLVQFVVAPEDVLTRATELAERMGGSAPLAVATAKSFLNGLVNPDHFGAVAGVVMLQGTLDAAEGISAFENRRPPRFTGS